MSSLKLIGAIATLVFALSSHFSLAQPASTYSPPLPSADYPYPNSGAVIGEGWDSFNETATTGSCVNIVAVPLEVSSYKSNVQQIQSTYSLATTNTTSISAAYHGFGASASGSLSTKNSLNINTDNQHFLFTFESSDGSTFGVAPGVQDSSVQLSDASIKGLEALKSDAVQQVYLAKALAAPSPSGGGSIHLTTEASALWNKDRAAFSKMCGDGFVSAIHRGARINLLLTQKFASLAEAHSLAASLSASGYGGSLNASHTTSTQRLNSTAGLAYRIFQQGGVPLKPVALPVLNKGEFFDVNTILPAPDQLIANPTAFSVTVTPYADIVRDASSAEQFPSPLRLLTLSDYYYALRDEYHLVETILTELRAGETGQDSAYDPRVIEIYGGENALEALYDSIHFDLGFLENAIAQCYSERRDCTIKSAVKSTMKSYAATLEHLQSYKKELESKSVSGISKDGKTPATAKSDANQEALPPLPVLENDIAQIAGLQAETSDGTLDPAFFIKFYQYVLLTPLPKAAYSGPGFEALQQLKFFTAKPGDKERELNAADDAIRRASFAFRLTPWKKFFCEKLNSSPMCVSDARLEAIAKATAPRVTSDQLTPVTPPPARPVPPVRWHPIDRGPCPGAHNFDCL